MPLYTITHTTPLSGTKKDKLASALTTLHATKFTTPKMFVNVRFVNAEHTHVETYVAGKSMEGKENNYLEAHVRAGAERPKALFAELAEEMVKIWEEVVSLFSTSKLARYHGPYSVFCFTSFDPPVNVKIPLGGLSVQCYPRFLTRKSYRAYLDLYTPRSMSMNFWQYISKSR